jgi:N-methylhydantoinase B
VIDPVTTEVIRSGFVSAAEQMNVNLARSAYTPIIYEMKDCSVALFNERIELLGQAPGLPLFIGALDAAIRVTVDYFGIDNMRDGDVYILNDSYLTGSHLNDVTILSPVYDAADLAGFAIAKAHWIDIGSMDPGVTLRATEIYQEGFRLGPTQLADAGRMRRDLVDLLAANSRLPGSILGDMQAMIAACRTGERRYKALLHKFGRTQIEAAAVQIFDQAERLDRAAVAGLPDGEYSAEGVLDNDGHSEDPLPVKVKVTVDGSNMTVDVRGSSPQRAACVNAGLPYTVSAARLAFKFLINPSLPVSGGSFRPLSVIAEPGSIFAAQEPAPTQRAAPCLGLLIDLFIRALAPIMPEQTAANQCADPMNVYLTGIDPRSGRRFIGGEALGIGWGGHATGDGESALINYGGGDLKNFPVETMEQRYPLKIRRFELQPDSGGAGQHRGGLGVVREYEMHADEADLSLWFERSVTPGLGLFGGQSGGLPQVTIDPDTPNERSLLKVNHLPIKRGTVIRAITGGGGGYGPASARSVERVQQDLADGYVTPQAAARDYPGGVLPSKGQ